MKYLPSVDVKWNSPLHICEANISQRSYFTWAKPYFTRRRRISPEKSTLSEINQGVSFVYHPRLVAISFLSEIFGVAECEIMCYRTLWNIAPSSHCEMKFALHICEANISQRSYFTWRSHISLAKGEFRWKKHLPKQVLFSGLIVQKCNKFIFDQFVYRCCFRWIPVECRQKYYWCS